MTIFAISFSQCCHLRKLLKMKCTYRASCFERDFIALPNKMPIRNIIGVKIVFSLYNLGISNLIQGNKI